MTKKQPTRTAYFNLHTLIGLAGVGIVLTALVVYAAGRTSTNKPPKQHLPSGPAPQGSVTEAWVRRINGPANGSDHGHDVAIDATGNIYVTGWIETSAGNEDCHTVKYSPTICTIIPPSSTARMETNYG
jgi:Beta-propeller repeat